MLIIDMKNGELLFSSEYKIDDADKFLKNCLNGKIEFLNCEDMYGNKTMIRTSEISIIRYNPDKSIERMIRTSMIKRRLEDLWVYIR